MARVVSRVAVAASLLVSLTRAATNATSDVSWCATTDKVALTTCGQGCEACAQYPTKASVTCSDAGRNKCQPSPDNAACTFQCLDLYNVVANKWTLFVKEPKASDAFSTDPTKTKPFPAAPVQIMSGIQVPADAKAIQITGYDAVNVIKGSTVDLTRDDSFFALAKLAETLTITNINLEKLQVNFLPLSLQTLIMDNCKLSDVPSDVGNMPNIRTLNISKNTISELPPVDGKVGKALQSLTALSLRSNSLTKFDFVLPSIQKLDLGDNKLTTFPMAIFNMSKLVTLNLDGNVLQPTNFTTDQFAFLKRLTDTSSLGFSARSCPPGSREDKVLDATVCVVSGASSGSTPTPAAAEKSGSSSTVIIIVCAVAGALLLVGGGAFIWHRRRAKTSEFYQSVMENNNSRGTMNATGNTNNSGTSASNYNNSGTGFTNNSGTGQSRPSFFNRSRAPSGGRPSRANSNASSRPSLGHRPSMSAPGNRPSKQSFSGTYSEIAKYQEERQSNAADTGSMSLVTGGSRQRERAQINQNVVRIASEDINYTRTIAKGAFGEVWLAHYGRDLVAVKKLLSSDPTSVGDFIAELNLLASLSHPRILALVGACWDDSQVDLQIVMEYMDSGDLLTVLRARSPTDLTWEKGKANYCVQVCEAIFYLHSLQPALIHRDIKSRNILIDARKGAKLSDFGESRERTVQNTMTAGVGTARWVAPEIILGEDYSELADIYSLGVLLTELDTHKIPFEGLNLEEHMIVQQVSVGKLRPKVSDSCPEVIRRLVHECLQFDPQLRPSAARVLQTLMASQLVRRLSTISDTEYE